MKNFTNEVPVFFAVDNSYVPFLSVTLLSLIDNCSSNNLYTIRIIYTDISDENINKIKKLEKANITIEFVNVTEKLKEIQDKLYTRNYYSAATYYRLLLPELYPDIKKAVYLDSDIAVLEDVAKLYNMDIGDKLLAAVPDGAVQTSRIFQNYVEKVIGMSDYNRYFNAGILLMNFEELRNYGFEEKFIMLLNRVKFEVAQDQDYFNRICKGRTVMLDMQWNAMPIMYDQIKKQKPKIVHYNLGFKPWHFDNIPFEKYFWKYAEQSEYYNEIKKVKEQYTEEEKLKDDTKSTKLYELAQKEAEAVGDDRIPRYLIKKWTLMNRDKRKTEKINEKHEERKSVMRKIERLEKEGKFDIDVEEDPPTVVLTPDNIDYLQSKLTSKVKRIFAYEMGEVFLDNLLRNNKLIIKNVNGIENLNNLNTGAIITCNHFNPLDCFAIEKIFRMSEKHASNRLYKIIREGNYTNFPGLYGFLFRNCDTLPLSSNTRTMVKFMDSVDNLLKNGEYVLIYPEQSMWWNYRKPKPLKEGAFKLAIRSNVPVLPIFITMQDSQTIGDDGFPIQEYTINIEKPIYPDGNLTKKENVQNMIAKNAETWKNVYEDFYGIKLEYTTELNS